MTSPRWTATLPPTSVQKFVCHLGAAAADDDAASEDEEVGRLERENDRLVEALPGRRLGLPTTLYP